MVDIVSLKACTVENTTRFSFSGLMFIGKCIKVIDGDTWHHKKIVLQPDSNVSSYEPIEFDNETFEELRVIGEFVAALS